MGKVLRDQETTGNEKPVGNDPTGEDRGSKWWLSQSEGSPHKPLLLTLDQRTPTARTNTARQGSYALDGG
jgi:hypothetical protein